MDKTTIIENELKSSLEELNQNMVDAEKNIATIITELFDKQRESLNRIKNNSRHRELQNPALVWLLEEKLDLERWVDPINKDRLTPDIQKFLKFFVPFQPETSVIKEIIDKCFKV